MLENFFVHDFSGGAFGAYPTFMHDGCPVAEPEYMVWVVTADENGNALFCFFQCMNYIGRLLNSLFVFFHIQSLQNQDE